MQASKGIQRTMCWGSARAGGVAAPAIGGDSLVGVSPPRLGGLAALRLGVGQRLLRRSPRRRHLGSALSWSARLLRSWGGLRCSNHS